MATSRALSAIAEERRHINQRGKDIVAIMWNNGYPFSGDARAADAAAGTIAVDHDVVRPVPRMPSVPARYPAHLRRADPPPTAPFPPFFCFPPPPH